MTKEEYLDFCRNIGGASADRPFEEDFDTWVVRHEDTRKWFGLVMLYEERDVVNLKCDPLESDFLRSVYSGVIPAYHMNKIHWNTVYLESDVPEEEIKRMTLNSFALTEKKRKKRAKENKEEL